MMPHIEREARHITRLAYMETDATDEKNVNLAKQLDEPAIIKLIERFFELMDSDDDPDDSFKRLYDNSKMAKEEIVQGYYEYLIQRLGGKPYFTERRGHPNLVSVHARVGVSTAHKNKWLALMEDAFDSMEDTFNPETKDILMRFFVQSCTTYVVGTQIAEEHACARLYDDDFMCNRIPDPPSEDDKKGEDITSSSDGIVRHRNYRK